MTQPVYYQSDDHVRRFHMNKPVKAWPRECLLALYNYLFKDLEREVKEEGRWELASQLAAFYSLNADDFAASGDNQGALMAYNQAIEIRERLVNQEGRHDLANKLASLYVGKAFVVAASGDMCCALQLYGQALEIRQGLVYQEDRRDLAKYLATTYMGKATAVAALGDFPSAVAIYGQALEVLECLVDHTATVYMHKSVAVELYRQTIDIRKRLIQRGGWHGHPGDLAWLLVFRAECLTHMGQTERGKCEGRMGIVALRAEAKRTGRTDLKKVIDWTARQIGEVP